PAWFHSKYAITDGVSAAWYRKLYYLNYLSGASAIFWEQGLGNQWILPGPGTHPIQLSPFGRATEDFHDFVNRLPDRGEPLAPVAFLLSAGHAYARVNSSCQTLGAYLRKGGTLVVNVEAARSLPAEWLGVKLTGKSSTAEEWTAGAGEPRATTPYEVAGVELAGAKVLAWATPKVPLITRQKV